MSGLGIGGRPRYGKPKTDEERRRTHFTRFRSKKLPPRGTGILGNTKNIRRRK